MQRAGVTSGPVEPPALEDARRVTHDFVASFFQGLAGAGVRHVCVSPGSRSTPLAVAASRQPELHCFVHVDERSAGFFALGLARASRTPVALVCTSGTAAANYLPAVVEAWHSRVPLVVLTADRPPELRGWDAGQTIDQLRLYGAAVRWFAELPVPTADPALQRYARSLGARAVAEARGQQGAPGPVHLNWPLREPLEPPLEPATPGRAEGPSPQAVRAPAVTSRDQLRELAALAQRWPRGVIACGPLDPTDGLPEAVVRLADRAGWPLLADPASGLRCGPHVGGDSPIVAHGDLLLRDDGFGRAHAPDLVLRLGATPVSKALRLWLEANPPRELICVDPWGGFSDPSHLASRVIATEPADLCRAWAEALSERPDRSWLGSWLAADAGAAAVLEERLACDDRLLEPGAVRELCGALPDDVLLYVSNSMPIRLLDACLPRGSRRLRVLANRGANGIDGMISSALGAAAAGVGRTLLLTGDLAFVHDLGGLLAGRRHDLSLVIVLLDNDGGGIFSFLPIAAHGESVRFEELFRTPHGLDLSHAARLFGAAYERVQSLEHLRAVLKDVLEGEGLRIVHVPVDRDASVAQLRALVAAVARPGGDPRP